MKKNAVKKDVTIRIFYKNKRVLLSAKRVSPIGKFLGLMFRSRETENLLFTFPDDADAAFHSLFVFFPFLMLWLDENKNVIEWRLVMPFSTAVWATQKYRHIVEIPLNLKNRRVIEFFVGRGKI